MSKVCVLPFTFNVTLLITDLLTRIGFRASSLVWSVQPDKCCIPETRGHKARAYRPVRRRGLYARVFRIRTIYTEHVIRKSTLFAYLLLPLFLVSAIGQTTQREPWPRETEQPDAAKPKDVPR